MDILDSEHNTNKQQLLKSINIEMVHAIGKMLLAAEKEKNLQAKKKEKKKKRDLVDEYVQFNLNYGLNGLYFIDQRPHISFGMHFCR